MNDLKFAFRQLLKNPGFTAVAVLTLALGIGLNLTLFEYFNRQLLRPLPVAKPEELWTILPADASSQPQFFNCSRYYYQAVRAQKGAFKRVIGYASDAAFFRSHDRWEELRITLVSGDYFDFLGIHPFLGRALRPDDEQPGSTPVAVISHRFWRRHFDQDPDVLGKTLDLSGQIVEVVGVMPEGFTGMQNWNRPRELWVPASLEGSFTSSQPGYTLVGRLDSEVSPKQAADSLAPVVQSVTETLTRDQLDGYSGNISGFTRVAVKPAGRGDIPAQWVNAEVYETFGLAATGTLLVLLIAILNLASLALARVLRRRKEIAMRIALGATRWPVIRLVVVEGLLLSGLGTLGAGLIAGWISRVLPAFMPATFSDPANLHVDVRVFTVAAGMALFIGIVLSVVPAVRATRFDPLQALKDPEGNAGLLEKRWPWGRVLVVFQVAGSFALLSGAFLCFNAISRQVRINVGFDKDRLILASANLWELGFRENDASAKAEELRQRLASLPGVKAVGLLAARPFSDFAGTMVSEKPDWIPGYTPPDGVQIETGFVHVGPGAFRSLGVPLLQGRDMTDADFAQRRLVALVNERFVRKFWPDQAPLGKEITILKVNTYQVIGVVADARLEKPDVPSRPTIYFSANDQQGYLPTFVIRAEHNPKALIASIRSVLRSAHPRLGESDVVSMQQAMRFSLHNERRAMSFLGWLAAAALGLTVLGIFGTVSYTVSQRTREYGVRLAVGARSRDVLKHVLRSGVVTAMAGIALGIPLALWGASVLRHSAYSVESSVLPALVTTTGVLVVANLAACFVPACRAARVDPMEALRYE